MPKLVDYPRASLKNCMLLSDAVNDLGGSCSAPMAADKLGKAHKSGAYSALVGATVKYGLLNNRKGQLEVTELYRDIKLAYDEAEVEKATQKAFLTPALFAAVYERFKNKALPVSHFEKLLIREFDVPDNFASRLSNYFLEGAKQSGLLGEGNILSRTSDSADEFLENGDDEDDSRGPTPHRSIEESNKSKKTLPADLSHPAEEEGKFSVRIKGPGMDSLIVVNEKEDLDIVKAMLKKVERRLSVDEEDETMAD